MIRSRLVIALAIAAPLVALACNTRRDQSAPSDRKSVPLAEAPTALSAAPVGPPHMVLGYGQGGQAGRGNPRPARPGSPSETYTADAMGNSIGGGKTELTGDVSGELRDVSVGSGAERESTDPSSLPTDATAPMIVRTGSATLKVDSLVPAIARLRLLAQRLGGYTGTTTIDVGTKEAHSATVELKVPSARWNELLDGVKPIGVLEHQEETTADVGEEYVDVGARVANAQRTEARLVDLLARRTGKLADVVEVEQELSSVREEIERYQGRMRYLRAHAAMSTMTVSVHEPIPIVANAPGERPIADAFGTAWHLFVGAVALFVASLGIIIPLGVIVALLWWIRRGSGRARFAD